MDDNNSKKDDQELTPLPGFRFYPTDEELLGFYLKRKVEKKPISMELIKQVDIYKFDPWDLSKACTMGEEESYFYCKRGRKYRNSVRPNRVTGSGFWKATGIDKPIFSSSSHTIQGELGRTECIGLKKSLVYYRGNAGKGMKTDWMMHEFRLPDQLSAKTNTIEAEVWTLCRIFKRNLSHRKYTSNWREMSSKRHLITTEARSNTCSVKSTLQEGNYISFRADQPIISRPTDYKKKIVVDHINNENINQFAKATQFILNSVSESQLMASSSTFSHVDMKNNNELFYANDNSWDELSYDWEFSSNSAPL